jgi:hypothetical protein
LYLKDTKALAKNFDEPEEVQELELNNVEAIIVASGQHCLAALQNTECHCKRHTTHWRRNRRRFVNSRDSPESMS